MNPIRVLHIMPTLDPAYGGPVQALLGLASAQAREGLSVRVLSPFRTDAGHGNADWLRSAGVNVDLVGPTVGPLAWHPQLSARLASAIADADIVHIHAVWEQVQHIAAKLARGAGTPYIVTPHGMLTSWALHRSSLRKQLKKRFYLAWRLRKMLNRSSAIHYTTEFERDLTAPLKLRPPAIVELLGLDMSEFEQLPPPGAFRCRYEIGERPLLTFLGRIFPGKGLEYLIPALARVEPKDVMLAIVGPDGGFEPQVREMIRQHALEERIVFTGMMRGEDKLAALADADLFCLPSDHENFGLVVIEALAAGTPVVISDQVAVHQQITDGVVGSAVKRDPELLAMEITVWLSDRERLAAAAERARPFVRERFAWPAIAARWRGHYENLTAHRAAAAASPTPAL